MCFQDLKLAAVGKVAACDHGGVAEQPAPEPAHEGTRVVRAGLGEPVQGEPLLAGPVFAGPFHLAGDPSTSSYGYQRHGNPTWTAYEAALGALEEAEAVVFASGMAAVSAVLVEGLRPGDVLVAPSDGYGGLRALMSQHLEPRGVEIRLVETDTDRIRASLEGATVVWLETPSNPGLEVCDIAAVAEAAHEAGAIVAVDNTLATPLGQRPLDLGADLSVTSGTKALTGHADLVIGHVSTRDAGRLAALAAWRTTTGAIPGPLETWLAHRSLATLDVRLERQCANALTIAGLLLARDDIEDVRYPGLAGDPSHGTAARQMTRFGPLVCFTLEGRERGERFLAGCRLVTEATSFGGVHTTAERRRRWGYEPVPEGFIRMSAGIEDPRDICADLAASLDAL